MKSVLRSGGLYDFEDGKDFNGKKLEGKLGKKAKIKGKVSNEKQLQLEEQARLEEQFKELNKPQKSKSRQEPKYLRILRQFWK